MIRHSKLSEVCRVGLASYFMVFVLVMARPITISAEDSPQYRGLRGNGVSDEEKWMHQWAETGPQVKWERETGIGFSSPVTKDGVVICTGYQAEGVRVSALDLNTGEEIWSFEYEAPLDAKDFEGGPTSSPLIEGDCVYLLSRGGTAYALRLADGVLLWQVDLVTEAGVRIPGWGFSGAVRSFNSRLLLNVGDSGVCLRQEDGMVLWASEDREAGYSSAVPFMDQGVPSVILGSGRSYVCVDIETGRERWRQKWLTSFGCNAADAVVSKDRVFLSSGYSRGSGFFDLSTGSPQLIWKHKDFKSHLGTGLLIDGFLYGVNGDLEAGARITCMELSTGKIRWIEESFRAGAVSAAGDRLIILSDDGVLMIAAVNSDSFELLASARVLNGRCWVPPVITEGKLLCKNSAGKLICLDLSE